MIIKYNDGVGFKEFIRKYDILHVSGNKPSAGFGQSGNAQLVEHERSGEVRLWWGTGNPPRDCILVQYRRLTFPKDKATIESILRLFTKKEKLISENYDI